MDRNRVLCTSCQAPMFFARTPSGATMPVNYDPVPDGNVVIRNSTALVLSQNTQVQPEEARYTSHYATCPRGRAHRKPQ